MLWMRRVFMNESLQNQDLSTLVPLFTQMPSLEREFPLDLFVPLALPQSSGSHIFGKTELGDNCTLMTGAVVGDDCPGCSVIGSNNTIGYHAVIGVQCQDLKYEPGDVCYLEVGHNNDIREHTSIHRSSKISDKTVIGDGNLVMGSCHIAHDCKIGNNNIFANNTLSSWPC